MSKLKYHKAFKALSYYIYTVLNNNQHGSTQICIKVFIYYLVVITSFVFQDVMAHECSLSIWKERIVMSVRPGWITQ